MNYIKEEISKSPNKYSVNPLTIDNNVKANHPNITTKFHSIRQTIYNYIEKEKEYKPKSFNQIKWNHLFFKDINGEPMLVSHSDYGFIFKPFFE